MSHNAVLVSVPNPKMGSKCWLLREKGIYVLEKGPGVLRGIACTHAGSGTLSLIDGLPDDKGFFPTLDAEEYQANGRIIFHANPAIMGMWMLDGGFMHGLTVIAEGGTEAASVIATVTWLPYLGG